MARRLSREDKPVYASLVGKWIKGAEPGADALGRIADEFGVTVDWLLGRSDERRPLDPTMAQRTVSVVSQIVQMADEQPGEFEEMLAIWEGLLKPFFEPPTEDEPDGGVP